MPNIEIGVDSMVKENFIYVGIDLHKETHTAVMIDCYNQKLGEITFPNRPADFHGDGYILQNTGHEAEEISFVVCDVNSEQKRLQVDFLILGQIFYIYL